MQVDWDIDLYATTVRGKKSGSSTRSNIGSQRFPKLFEGIIEDPISLDKPAIITDKHDRIICWYLPQILPPVLQVCSCAIVVAYADYEQGLAMKAAADLNPLLKRPQFKAQVGSKTWRNDAQHFRREDKCQITPGVMNISPAWFAQGHPVRY